MLQSIRNSIKIASQQSSVQAQPESLRPARRSQTFLTSLTPSLRSAISDLDILEHAGMKWKTPARDKIYCIARNISKYIVSKIYSVQISLQVPIWNELQPKPAAARATSKCNCVSSRKLLAALRIALPPWNITSWRTCGNVAFSLMICPKNGDSRWLISDIGCP